MSRSAVGLGWLVESASGGGLAQAPVGERRGSRKGARQGRDKALQRIRKNRLRKREGRSWWMEGVEVKVLRRDVEVEAGVRCGGCGWRAARQLRRVTSGELAG